MDTTRLLDALQQDILDQRSVTDLIVLLNKSLRSATASSSATERSSSPTPAGPERAERLSADGDNNQSATRHQDEHFQVHVTELKGQHLDVEGLERMRGEDAKSDSGNPDKACTADCDSKPRTKPRTEQSLLLDLVRGFRGEMLRVESNLRAAMFRAVRYLVRTSADADVVLKQRFGLFIAIALAREQYDLWERMQALKLVKQIMAVDASKVPREVVRTVVAVSGHKEDNFRRVCLETLRDLAVADPRIVAHANGFRVLFAAATDPATQDLADSLVTTLMLIVEDPATRKYVRPQLEIHQLLSGFTDLDVPPGAERTHRWKATRKALVVAMRSWAGVHLLASDPRGLVALMRLLRDPSASFSEDAELQDSILDTILDICEPLVGMCRTMSSIELGNKQRDPSFVDKLFSTPSGGAVPFFQRRTGSGLRSGTRAEPHNILLNYATLLCAAFVHCGLISSLTTLCIATGSEGLRAKAAKLLVDVLHLCAMLLSQNQCTRLLSMPGIVHVATECQTSYIAAGKGGAQTFQLTRSRASRASDLIRLLHEALGAGAGGPVPLHLELRTNEKSSSYTAGWLMQKVYDMRKSIGTGHIHRNQGWEPAGTLQQMRKELRLSFESTVDKSCMDTQMAKSKVLGTKDWTKWDWEIVDYIVQDILPHPPRLMDALRTKWIKRVSGFYRFVGANSGSSTDRGGGGGLHNMRWDSDNIRHIACAGRLYALLLQQPEGVHFLETDSRGGILQEIVKELQALVTRRCNLGSGSSRFTGPWKVFDMETCQRRMSGVYITLLFGVAAATDVGRELLLNMGLGVHLESMGCQQELDYMSRLILTRMDLSCDKFIARDLLKSWMTAGSSDLRLFAVNIMRSVVRHTNMTHRQLEGPLGVSHLDDKGNAEDTGMEMWCIETLVAQLNGGDPAIARTALSVLEEAAQDEGCLRTLVLMKPDLINMPGGSNLLMRFMSIPEGIQYLDQLGWVERMMVDWKHNGRMTEYVANLDATWKAHVNEVEHVEDTLEMEASPEHGGNAHSESPVPIPIRTDNLRSSQADDMADDERWDGSELQLLLGLPWNIDVVLSRDSTPAAGLHLRVDTWVDTSPIEAVQSQKKDIPSSSGANTMVVRGVLVDAAGRPTCHPLEANLTLHARLSVGGHAIDRLGNIKLQPMGPGDTQAATFRRNRPGRPSRPQSNRAEHGTYGGNNLYLGGQLMQDFGQTRDKSEDPTDKDNKLFWSACRSHQRVAKPKPVVNPRYSVKGSLRSGVPMRPISPSLSSKTAHEESHGSGAESVFIASGNVSTAGESGAGLDDNDAHENEEEKGVSDLVVNVPGETARWVFTDRPGQEDPIAMQVVENSSLKYLKAVEFTISIKDLGPSAFLLPSHLYGELAKTERGCNLLRQHGDLKSLLHTLRNSSSSTDVRRGALWALAHVSRWPLGFSLLEELQENFVATLLAMCTSESQLSVWRTAFCSVSLVARTPRGRAAIRKAGWESARDPSTNVFLPSDPAILFQPVPWQFEGSLSQGLDEQASDPVISLLWKDLTDQQRDVLQQVAKLSSHITRKEAIRKLNRMRKDKEYKEEFTNSIPVFILVHQLLADYSFSLPMRRYLFENLFDQVAPRTSDWKPYVLE